MSLVHWWFQWPNRDLDQYIEDHDQHDSGKRMGLQRPKGTIPAGSDIWREDLKEAKKGWKRLSGHMSNLYGHKEGRRGLEEWGMVRFTEAESRRGVEEGR